MVLPETAPISSIRSLRGRGAGVTKSVALCVLNGLLPTFDVATVLRSVADPMDPALRRTIRGLRLVFGGGEEAELSFSAGRNAIGSDLFSVDTWPSSDATSVSRLVASDGGDASTRDASSPSIAFASALNFIGGTGSSSSELSPIEYCLVARGGADVPLKVATRDRGDPRLRCGLAAWSRTKGREGGRLGRPS